MSNKHTKDKGEQKLIKNKFIIAGILGVIIGLGVATTTATVAKAETIQEESKEHEPKTNVEAVQAVNDIIDPLLDAKNSNNIKEFKRLVNKFRLAVDTAERFGVDDLTMQDLREREYLWQGYLDKKEAELVNVKKKSTPKEEVTKPKAPVVNETKLKNKKAKEATSAKATEKPVENKSKTKVKEPKEVVVKEEPVTKSNEDAPIVDKVSNEEPTPTEEVKETVKEEATPTTTPVKEEVTPKDTSINKSEQEANNIESTLLAKVMVIVGAVLVIVGAVAAIKIKKKN